MSMISYISARKDGARGSPGSPSPSSWRRRSCADPAEGRRKTHDSRMELGMSTMELLRNPDVPAQLRKEPCLAVSLVEELLRFEPPVQLLPQRTPLVDIEVGGTTRH